MGGPHFVLIRKQTWPTQAILVSDWLISKKSSHLKPSSQMYNKFQFYSLWFDPTRDRTHDLPHSR
jgi:hypothetical protein